MMGMYPRTLGWYPCMEVSMDTRVWVYCGYRSGSALRHPRVYPCRTLATAVLTEAFEGGTDVDACPDDDDIVYALVAGITDAEGLDPSTIEEAWT